MNRSRHPPALDRAPPPAAKPTARADLRHHSGPWRRSRGANPCSGATARERLFCDDKSPRRPCAPSTRRTPATPLGGLDPAGPAPCGGPARGSPIALCRSWALSARSRAGAGPALLARSNPAFERGRGAAHAFSALKTPIAPLLDLIAHSLRGETAFARTTGPLIQDGGHPPRSDRCLEPPPQTVLRDRIASPHKVAQL